MKPQNKTECSFFCSLLSPMTFDGIIGGYLTVDLISNRLERKIIRLTRGACSHANNEIHLRLDDHMIASFTFRRKNVNASRVAIDRHIHENIKAHRDVIW